MNVTLLNFDDYQEKALRTLAPDTHQMVIAHCVVGIAGEVGEILRAELTSNLNNEIEEIGDTLWYCAVLSRYLEITSGLRFSEVVKTATMLDHYPIPNALNMDVLVLSSGEMLDALKRHLFYKKPLNDQALYEQLIRVVYCLMKRAKYRHQTDLLKVGTYNITKLALRFGDKYSEFKVTERDLKAEEAVFLSGDASQGGSV